MPDETTATTLDTSREESKGTSARRSEESAKSPESARTLDRELSRDEIFDVLRNWRRRAVLEYLRTHDEASTTKQLAEHIAAAENGVSVDQLSSEQRKRVYVSLYQNHLPKMDSAGVIGYDQNRGTVEPRNLSEVSPYLSPEADSGGLGGLYAALGVGAVCLVGLSGVSVLSAVPNSVWVLASTLTLLIVVAVEIRRKKGSLL